MLDCLYGSDGSPIIPLLHFTLSCTSHSFSPSILMSSATHSLHVFLIMVDMNVRTDVSLSVGENCCVIVLDGMCKIHRKAVMRSSSSVVGGSEISGFSPRFRVQSMPLIELSRLAQTGCKSAQHGSNGTRNQNPRL